VPATTPPLCLSHCFWPCWTAPPLLPLLLLLLLLQLLLH
jgi:hypothetical protein